MSNERVPEARIFLKALNFYLSSTEMQATRQYINPSLTLTKMIPRHPATAEGGAVTYDFHSIKFRYKEQEDDSCVVFVVHDDLLQEKEIWVDGLLLCRGANLSGRMFVKPLPNSPKTVSFEKSIHTSTFVPSPKEWKDLKIGIVVNSGEKCGISEHTKYFTDKLKCSFKIYPVKNSQLLAEDLVKNHVDVVHIQHEFSIFPTNDEFVDMVKALKAIGIKVILDLHTVIASPFLTLVEELADKIIVHNPLATTVFTQKQKVESVPLATPIPENLDKQLLRDRYVITGDPVISSFGFINRDKGFDETLEAIAQLREKYPRICFLLVGSLHPKSKEADYLTHLHNRARELGVNVFWKEGFYPIEIVHELLSCSDLSCLFYRNMSALSGSGPARVCLASHRPLIVSDVPMFAEFQDAVVRVPEGNVFNLANAIRQLLENMDSQKALIEKGDNFLKGISAEYVAQRFEGIYRELGCEKT